MPSKKGKKKGVLELKKIRSFCHLLQGTRLHVPLGGGERWCEKGRRGRTRDEHAVIAEEGKSSSGRGIHHCLYCDLEKRVVPFSAGLISREV